MLYIDQQIINFNNFLPGKILGSTLIVVNKTDSEQIIELSVEQSRYTFRKQEIVQMFPKTAEVRDNESKIMPFAINDKHSPNYKEKITNSEMKYECWYIENPVSKELTKRITLKLSPKAEQDFIIVLRSPMV